MRAYHKTGGRKGKPGYCTPSSFRSRVFKVAASIPRGKMLSYKEVARRAGNTLAYRAVGNILSRNYDPKIPCHRVIKSDGAPGGYNRGTKNKTLILKKEKAL